MNSTLIYYHVPIGPLVLLISPATHLLVSVVIPALYCRIIVVIVCASDGEDYIPISDNVTLIASENSYCFQLVTVDDDVLEAERETLSLTVNLTSHIDRVNVQQDSLDVTIVDNDGNYIFFYLLYDEHG